MLLKGGAGCGEFMGQDNLERLSNCNQDISAHLRRYHLSKESLSEYDLILLRRRDACRDLDPACNTKSSECLYNPATHPTCWDLA